MAEKPSRIDHQALAHALNAEPTAVQDVAYGQGNRLTTEGGQVLEVFPGAVRLTGPDVALVVQGNQLRQRVGDDWVSFEYETETHTRTVAVRRSGDVLFRRTLRDPQTPPETPTTPTLRTPTETRPVGDPVAIGTRPETPPP